MRKDPVRKARPVQANRKLRPVSHAVGSRRDHESAARVWRLGVTTGVNRPMRAGNLEAGAELECRGPVGPLEMLRTLFTVVAAAAVLMGIVYVGLAALSAPAGWLTKYAESTLTEAPAQLTRFAVPN
jgi:hypothetical protein